MLARSVRWLPVIYYAVMTLHYALLDGSELDMLWVYVAGAMFYWWVGRGFESAITVVQSM